MKKIISAITALVLVFSLSTVAFAEEQVSAFSDVPKDHWAYTSIMAMTKQGLFSGKGQIVNRVGVFAPNDIMSRAEFVTVVVRALYKDELTALPAVAGAPWYANAYSLAIDKGLLNEVDLDAGNLTKPMNRQEMSMLLSRAATIKGETPPQLVNTNQIPDYNEIGTAYQDDVVIAYSMGMLCGTDKSGTFTPMGIMDRATAATVLYRLVEPSSRQPVDFNKPVTPPVTPPVTGSQKWVEGQAHSEPKAGDIVIKDGKEIVLKATQVGDIQILGFGQNVDHITGTTINGVVCTEGNLGGAWLDYNGNDLTAFLKDPLTGSVFTEYEWGRINLNTIPNYRGTKEGERANTYFVWDTVIDDWCWVGPC